jgi:glutaconate CoA-transferase subunit B
MAASLKSQAAEIARGAAHNEKISEMAVQSSGVHRRRHAVRHADSHATCERHARLPSVAANLARRTHVGDIVLVYESGTIGAKPNRLPLSIGDGELAETADSVVSVPEIFNYWLQGGRIDVGFLGAAQMDRFANLNSTVIGPYDNPSVRLPGAGGAPEIAASCREVIIVMRQSLRSFVRELDFVTSVGHGRGNGDRERLGLRGGGPTLVISDLGLLRPNRESLELEMTHLHPGVTLEQAREATGWDLRSVPEVLSTSPPSPTELAALRELGGGSSPGDGSARTLPRERNPPRRRTPNRAPRPAR